jgi:hypothetical protein
MSTEPPAVIRLADMYHRTTGIPLVAMKVRFVLSLEDPPPFRPIP